MSFTRVAEFHGEVSDYEIMQVQVSSNRPTRSAVNPLTGAYAWRWQNLSTPAALPLYGATAMRVSLHQHLDNLVPIGLNDDVNVIKIMQESTTSPCIELRMMEDENETRLYVDGVQRDVCVSTDNLIGLTGMYVQVALVVDSTVPYVSVYTSLPDTDPNFVSRILNWTGAISNTPWSHILIGDNVSTNGYSTPCDIDDGYVDIMSGEADHWPPPYRYLPSYVDAAGAHADFTPLSGSNFQMVDDGAVDDEDVTYNKVLTNIGDGKDSFQHGGVSLPANFQIVSAIPFVVTRKLNAGQDAQIENIVWDGLNLSAGSPHNVGISYGPRSARFLTQPDGSNWNEVDFNAMNFGYRVAGSFS